MTAAALVVLACLGAVQAAPPAKPMLGESAVDWLRVYPLAPYREYWSTTVEVKDLAKDLPRVMQALEKSGGTLIVPLEHSAGSPSASVQQLSYRLSRAQASAALKPLAKAGRFAPPLIRQGGELLPLSEIKSKIAALSKDREAHAAELAAMPAVASLVDAVLGHLVTAKAVAEKTEIEVIFNLTVQGPARP